MKPIDPRLTGSVPALRVFLAAQGLLALVQAACVAAVAWLIAATVAAVAGGGPASALEPLLLALTAAVVLRAVVVWGRDVLAARTAATVKSRLRTRLTDAIARLGPAWTARRNSASLQTTVGPGLDALDGYLTAYLPQLVLTLVATPAILVILFVQDVLTGVIVVVTLPLIPVFMILIGLATRFVQRRHYDALHRLSVVFLDTVEGLATLKIFGRERHQDRRIRQATDDYRAQTMRVLRVSFLSGFVLEFVASLSVAVVAVSVGVRLIDGSLPLAVGLSVLVLTPEAYLPIRQVGVQFHAAAEGTAAAEAAFAILDDAGAGVRPLSVSDGVRAAESQAHGDGIDERDSRLLSLSKGASLTVADLDVDYDERPAVQGFGGVFDPGTVTAITGPSGAGKSTLFAALLGFAPHRGRIELGGVDLSRLGREQRLALIAWSGQRPGLLRGTVAENVALGDPDPRADLVHAALRQAAVGEVAPGLHLGVAGSGLSGGQAQRVAIARAFYRVRRLDTPLLLLDEPTSALDADTEAQVVSGLAEHARHGRIVLVVSHRPAVVGAADREIGLADHAAGTIQPVRAVHA